MLSLYWGTRLIGLYPQPIEPLFKRFCEEHKIIYEYIDGEGAFRLFPVLKGCTIALYPLESPAGGAQKVAESLSEQLAPWGALTIYIKDRKRVFKIVKILKVQILLSLADKSTQPGKKGLKFYYSVKKKEESLTVIAAIAERLVRHQCEVSYEVADFFDFLKNPGYLPYVWTDVPTVLVELNGLREEELAQIEEALLDGLVDRYGTTALEEQGLKIRELTAYLAKQANITY
ncbi:MAG: hypothetical protein RBT41_02065 [Clostridia bacterium]|jgi:hypothetical protein|nr:hypothetical protein [Clostridia bacterium]